MLMGISELTETEEGNLKPVLRAKVSQSPAEIVVPPEGADDADFLVSSKITAGSS